MVKLVWANDPEYFLTTKTVKFVSEVWLKQFKTSFGRNLEFHFVEAFAFGLDNMDCKVICPPPEFV